MGLPGVLSSQLRSAIADHKGIKGTFSDSVARLLDKIDCRRVECGEQREAIFRLRYQAYRREEAIPPNSSGTFSDSYDEKGNVYLFGLYLDGELASSVRIHLASREHPDAPTLEAFPDVLQPELAAGKVIVDPTRFVTDQNLSRLHRGLPLAAIRIAWMAVRYFRADHFLAPVRVGHQGFYRRTFHHRLICEARPYPHLAKPICLMTVHYPAVADDVHRRYPFFRSTFFERRRLFERSGNPVPSRG